MLSKWVCSECKHSNNSHARYCMKCGQFKEGPSIKKATVTWVCPICKKENNDYAKYCRKCGHWLLSENYPPTRIEKGGQKTYSNTPKTSNQHERKMSKTSIIEIILIIFLGFLIFIDEGSLIQAIPFILIWIFFIHVVFSVFYIVKAFLRKGFVEGGKTLLIHGTLLIVFFIVAAISDFETNSNPNIQTDSSLTTIKNSAIELEYEDLLRNANGKYKNIYVKISGKVYHLDNGNQKSMMVNTASDPFNYQAVYIKRLEQDQTVIINDNVVIYGKVMGTMGTTNYLGTESAVPFIESYSLIIQNE